MNHYHIYEALGRSKYSTVYKGRKKKTIEYYAIKSVDKSQRSKVLQQVRILHTLNHPNVLKFYSWYETSAHLWLVLEYCVGGDLSTLLQQDGKLPEDSVHDFGRSLVTALQYLHSKGIIYCDLKPSNILLDENGHTKLCDFGLARKLNDIATAPSPQPSQAKQGTPSYMAPELFKEDGVHSYASDLWSLGCVLYECYTGRPPFVEKESTQLAKSVLLDEPPPLPGAPTQPFVNLVNSLLIKDPVERIQWPELCSHPFWGVQLEPLPLPPQPTFSNMTQKSHKPHGDGPCGNKTPSKTAQKDPKVPVKQDENSRTRTPVLVKQDENSRTRTPIKKTGLKKGIDLKEGTAAVKQALESNGNGACPKSDSSNIAGGGGRGIARGGGQDSGGRLGVRRGVGRGGRGYVTPPNNKPTVFAASGKKTTTKIQR